MPDVSIVIPARNEKFLTRTIEDVLVKAQGNFEIIPVLDGYWVPDPIGDPRIVYLHLGASRGMRGAINAGVAIAKGKYIFKCDGHCMFDAGFDVKLMADMKPNWVVIPRRKRLNALKWEIEESSKPDIDYEYLGYPLLHGNWDEGLHGKIWNQRAKERADILIDDNMSAQGSAWFMEKAYFHELELEDEKNYGTFYNEFQEVGLKCWLSGGRVVVNKKTWYAHLHKTGETGGRGYRLAGSEATKAIAYTNKWLTNSAWAKQTLPFGWLIEKFWPLPEWPEDRTKWAPPTK
jgi:glycosyltransferase involved in cell wall biosynthesis